MKLLFLAAVLTLSAMAQTIASGPKVWDLGHRSAMVYFTWTGGTITTAVLHYGPTSSYGTTTNCVANTTVSTAWCRMVDPVPLDPGTEYHYKIVINGADATGDLTFTTLSTPIEDPVPVAQVSFGNDEPAGTYNADYVLDECSDWAAARTFMAGLAGSNHQRVILGGEWVSTGCGHVQFEFPVRPSHTGWVIVQNPSVGTMAFTPSGIRTRPAYSSLTAKMINNVPYTPAQGSANYNVGTFPCVNQNAGGYEAYFHLTTVPSGTAPVAICRDDWPAHSGTITVTAQPCTINAQSDVVFSVEPGHGVQPGMLVFFGANECSTNPTNRGGYLVRSVTATTIELWNVKRKTGWASVTTPFNMTVAPDWRQPTAPEVSYGTGNPSGSCTEKTYYVDTSAASNDSLWWCVDDTGSNYASTVGKWRRIIPKFSGDGSFLGILTVASGAARYRFVGLELISPAVPNPVYPGWFNLHGLLSRHGANTIMAGVPLGEKIVFDRMYVHAEGNAIPPIRMRSVYSFADCSDCGVINSYHTDFNAWQGPTAAYTQSEGPSWITHHSGGPSLVRNNYAKGAATIFWYAEQRAGMSAVHDSTLYRNTIESDFRFMTGHPDNDVFDGTPYEGVRVGTRNMLEQKHGKRFLWSGNRLYGYWMTLTHGQFFILQNSRNLLTGWPVESFTGITDGVVAMSGTTYNQPGDGVVISGTSTAYDGIHRITGVTGCNIYGNACTGLVLEGGLTGSAGSGSLRHIAQMSRNVGDVDIRWNVITNGSDVLRIVGPMSSALASTSVQTGIMRRVRMSDNLFVNITTNIYRSPDATQSNAGVRVIYPQTGVESILAERNTFYGIGGGVPRLTMTETYNWGLRQGDNVWVLNDANTTANLIEGNSIGKITGLNSAYSPGGWSITNDVVCCVATTAHKENQPAGITWPGSLTSDVKFRNGSFTWTGRVRDYALKYDSPYKSGGSSPSTDRKDRGVDTVRLSRELGEVLNPKVLFITSNSAVFAYTAPDTQTCIIEVSSSPGAWGTGVQVVSPGSYFRTASVDGLTPNTVYEARFMCEAEQPVKLFRTNP